MIFLQVAISDLHKQTIAEHRLSIEPTDAGVASNVATTQSDELRRRRRLNRWRKEKRQLDFIKVLCHPAIKEIDVSQEVRPKIFFSGIGTFIEIFYLLNFKMVPKANAFSGNKHP